MIVSFLQNVSKNLTVDIMLSDGDTVYLSPLDIIRNVDIVEGQNFTGISFQENIPIEIKQSNVENNSVISQITLTTENPNTGLHPIDLEMKLPYLNDLSEISDKLDDKKDLSEIIPRQEERDISEIKRPIKTKKIKRKYKRKSSKKEIF